MKTKITKRAVDDLRSKAKSEGRTLYLRDDELTGFGALSTKAGACSYFVEYRLGGRGTTQKRMTIGKHGALTPDEARKLAKEELGKVARRVDVAQERKDERAQAQGRHLPRSIGTLFRSQRQTGKDRRVEVPALEGSPRHARKVGLPGAWNQGARCDQPV